MGKHSTFVRQKEIKKRETHPIWRGIGCIFMVLTPIIAVAAAIVLVDLNGQYNWLAVPAEILSPWLHPYLFIYIALTPILSLVVYAVLSILNYLLYSLFGPSQYGPMDAAPMDYKKRKR